MKHINDIPLPPDRENWGFVKDLQEPSDFHIRWESKFHAGKGELDLVEDLGMCDGSVSFTE